MNFELVLFFILIFLLVSIALRIAFICGYEKAKSTMLDLTKKNTSRIEYGGEGDADKLNHHMCSNNFSTSHVRPTFERKSFGFQSKIKPLLFNIRGPHSHDDRIFISLDD